MAKTITADDFEPAARQLLLGLLAEQGPAEPRVERRDADLTWDDDALEQVAEHAFAVLGRSDDLTIFFDEHGELLGWRDEGRHGLEHPAIIDRDAARNAIIAELGLAPSVRLGQLKAAELPPLGWTHQAVIFLNDPPADADVLRLWLAPKDLKIIQCLYGPIRQPAGGQP